MSDPAELDKVRVWGREALSKAERIRVGRPRIGPGERRRIVLQQRIRVRPDDRGYYKLETIAPSPIATIPTGGRISVVMLLPWEDENIRPRVVEEETTREFEYEQGRVKMRLGVGWHWRNDPLLRLTYRYE